jgi:endoglucanase
MLSKFKRYSSSAIVGTALTLAALFILAFYLPSVIIALSGQKELAIVKGQEVPAQSVEIWWPQQNASLQGIQTFKALVPDLQPDQYSLSWQLDQGSEVPMTDNSDNPPDKEASVDVSGWTWNGSGPYSIIFRARDLDGNVIASTSLQVFATSAATDTNSAESAATAFPDINTSSQAASLALTPLSSLLQSISSQAATSSQVISQGESSSSTSQDSISVWWPLDNTSVSGTQPLKAMIQGRDVSTYTMYWQIDGGTLNELANSYTDYQHKEYDIDFSGWTWLGNGPYHVTLVAKDNNNNVIATKILTLYVGQHNSQPVQPHINAMTTATTTSTVITSSVNPFQNQTLYVSPSSDAATQAAAWQSSRPADASTMLKIAAQPVASWFGNWDSSVSNDVKSYVSSASAQGSMPVLVAYNIPQRDCGGYSAGGSDSAEAYETWISQFASVIGSAKAAVILEPDSLAQSSCLSSTDLSRRYSLLNFAVTTLKANPNTAVYLDAGHSGWINADEMADMLKQAGVAKADGFALNVSNFVSTSDNTSYGEQISALLGGTHFVIDTGRNGTGGNGQWCNPSDQALGQAPTVSTGNPLIDAYLWIKTPGESDGTCNGGPSAGTWWPDYALDLAKRAGW